MKISPIFDIDFYKAGHIFQYPEGTEMVYSNFTPRSDRLYKGSKFYDSKVVVLGIEMFVKDYLVNTWNEQFFALPKEEIVTAYQELMNNSLGGLDASHVEALHDLGYLPINICALPEGSLAPMKCPVLTIYNTKPEFFWLVNYLESVMSSELWGTMTTATIALDYKRILVDAAKRTGCDIAGVAIQAHDFSFRGMSSRETASKLGVGHLSSFIGTDTVPAIKAVQESYIVADGDPVGVSVPATEHSVMCMGQKESEIETFRRLIEDVYPTGIISIVSDTWDYWKVITEYLPALKDKIMARQPNAIGLNKVVIRPDSGDPVKIICGYKIANTEYNLDGDTLESIIHLAIDDGQWEQPEAYKIDGKYYTVDVVYNEDDSIQGYNNYQELTEAEVKGSIECMWETFGGTITETGHKLLDEHIGLIYGDSITIERCQEIVDRLEAKGFASTNVVFGVGSYTYQYNTRDTFGFAMKATYGEVNGEGREIFKDPKTDSGVKRSAKGLLRVDKKDGEFVLTDQLESLSDTVGGCLEPVFCDGEVLRESDWTEIKARIEDQI